MHLLNAIGITAAQGIPWHDGIQAVSDIQAPSSSPEVAERGAGAGVPPRRTLPPRPGQARPSRIPNRITAAAGGNGAGDTYPTADMRNPGKLLLPARWCVSPIAVAQIDETLPDPLTDILTGKVRRWIGRRPP